MPEVMPAYKGTMIPRRRLSVAADVGRFLLMGEFGWSLVARAQGAIKNG